MSRWTHYLERYRSGEWRAPIFRDMILDDAQELGKSLTFLDIGCGGGFDDDVTLQKQIAHNAAKYIGIEPDTQISLPTYFTDTYRCPFEGASLQSCSINVAFAVMVLEHISEPELFLDKLYEVLSKNGIFWGFTMDARHVFCKMSAWMKRLRIKDLYLNKLLGTLSINQYNNYPTYYLMNSPEQILPHISKFNHCDFISFSRIGQLNYYLPKLLHPLANHLDDLSISKGKPGSVLAVRLTK